MEVAEAKQVIETAIDERFKKYEGQLKATGKVSEDVKTEIANLADKFNEITERQKQLEANQGVLSKQGDAIEIWTKRQGQEFGERTKGFVQDLKEQFVTEKETIDKIQSRKARSVNFDIEHGQDYLQQKVVGTMTIAASSSGVLPTSFSNNFVMPQNRKLHIRQLIPSTPMTDANYSYPKYTDGDGGVGIQTEGSAKSQSDADIQYITLAPIVIAHWMRVSEQMLMDIPRLLSVISNRMVEQLLNYEDNEILNGAGGANRLNGIITQASAFVPQGAADTASADRFSYLLSALSQLAQLNYTPNGILVNPRAYYEFLQVKTTAKEYTAPVAGITWLDNTLRLAGVPVYQSTAMAANAFLVGDWNEAELLARDAMQVDISREDADNFTKNLVTVRVEERVGLAVYKPGAFVTGSWTALAS